MTLHRTPRWNRKAALAAIAGAMLAAPAAIAQEASIPVPFENTDLSEDKPVTLQANQLDYDKGNQLVIATGEVEVSQGKTVLQADELIYDQLNDVVYARGNVVVLEPTGNVYFADEVELTESMQRGAIANIQARLVDNSLFAADEAMRQEEGITDLLRAVYSPCSVVCDDGTPKTPLWQIKAGKATIDQNEEDVTYEDVTLDVYGVPVAYTPYFSHATPGAENTSGLMTPQYRHDDNLGHVVEMPFYWAIAPDKDLTTTLMYASEEAPVVLGEYRQRFDSGHMEVEGSITRPDDRDAAGNKIAGNTTRGHIFADGTFQLSQDWQWGFDINRTTDDTYLRRYDFNRDPLLTSRLFGEGFDVLDDGARSYAVAQGLAFQGMQQQDDRRRSPFVLPKVDAYYQSLPGWANSRFTLTGGMMALARDLGADSQRASFSGEWMIPHITPGGHILEFATKMRADAYNIDNYMLANNTTFDGTKTRVIPQLSASWRYPLIKHLEDSSLIVEPVVEGIASPTSGNSQLIPNEDSATPEFTDTNLFSDNRFPGYDRVEVGPRVNYGVRSQWQFLDNKFFTAMAGQTYRTDDSPLFPLSTNLSDRFSDYVGKFGLFYDPFDITFRYRLDKDNFELNRSEVFSTVHFSSIFSGSLNYLKLRNDPIISEREEVSGGASLRLAENWWWNASAHHNLLLHEMISAHTGLVFQNECLTVNTMAGRNYTQDRDFQESTTFKVQVLLKNLN